MHKKPSKDPCAGVPPHLGRVPPQNAGHDLIPTPGSEGSTDGKSVCRIRFLEIDFVLDVIKDAIDVAPYRQSDTSPVLGRLWLNHFDNTSIGSFF